ncbi:hypothetical protein AYI70_g674 [Smittium culicis]|uniref:Uncharacterized protein n=1 Tax=Smittium culicis TaxID=133412 RepID=A0A1R1YFV1_9FUNG|nr:hypothetical protein AYI70_g674 [Smittium culicis]
MIKKHKDQGPHPQKTFIQERNQNEIIERKTNTIIDVNDKSDSAENNDKVSLLENSKILVTPSSKIPEANIILYEDSKSSINPVIKLFKNLSEECEYSDSGGTIILNRDLYLIPTTRILSKFKDNNSNI